MRWRSNEEVSLIQVGTRADSSVSAGRERFQLQRNVKYLGLLSGHQVLFYLEAVANCSTLGNLLLINKNWLFISGRRWFFFTVVPFAIHPFDSAGWI